MSDSMIKTENTATVLALITYIKNEYSHHVNGMADALNSFHETLDAKVAAAIKNENSEHGKKTTHANIIEDFFAALMLDMMPDSSCGFDATGMPVISFCSEGESYKIDDFNLDSEKAIDKAIDCQDEADNAWACEQDALEDEIS